MDPTTVVPPPPPHSPENQNPHTFSGDGHRPITSRKNMDNFRALVMKLAGRLLPAHKSLIGRRFDDIFPDELLLPDHPPYADMILTALRELNTKGGSSEAAISGFIEKEYHELPWAHATMLSHHLRDLCVKGEIVMTRDRCYLHCSSITSPSPCRQNLCLDDDDDSSYSSPNSGSSASLCSSSPSSSSSSSFCSGPPYQKRKRRLKRKRKSIKGTRCKIVQRRGRGRKLRTIQVGQRGRSVKISEKTLIEEERVDDDLAVENISKLEKWEQYQPQKRYNVTWIGRGEHVQGKGECVKQKESGSKQQLVGKEPFRQLEDGINNKQGRQRKQYNVVWIGRGVRKPKEGGEDLLEDECDEEVIDLEDDSASEEDAEMIDCDSEVDEQLKPKEENRQPDKQLTSVTDNKVLPCEQHERVEIEAELEVSEKLLEVLPETLQVDDDKVKEDQYLLSEGQEVGIVNERCGKEKQVEGESMEEDQLSEQEDRLGDDEQDLAMMQCEAPVTDASVEKQHEEQIRPEQVQQSEKGTKEEVELETHEQQNGGGAEQEMLEMQVQMVGKPFQDKERDAMMIQSEVETVEKTETEERHDCLTEEQLDTKEQSEEHDDATKYPIKPQEKCVERTEEEDNRSCGPDRLNNGKAESDAEQPQQDEQQTEINQEEIGVAMDSEVQQIQNESEEHCMGGNEFQLHKQQEKDAMEEVQVEGGVEVAKDEHRQKQLNEVKEKDIGLMQAVADAKDFVMTQSEAEVEGDSEQHNESEVYQDQLEKRENVTSEVQPQQEGQNKEVLQGESEQMNNLTALKQDVLMIESGSQLESTSVEHNEVQKDDTVVEQVQPQKQLVEEETKEVQNDENKPGFEEYQSEGQKDEKADSVERIEERSQPCIQQIEVSKKSEHQEDDNAASDENLVSSSSAVDVSGFSCKSLGVAEVNLSDDKHQDEQRRPLRQGLRSSCKKEETTTKTKNHLEQVTPVRRSLRPRKTVSEAAVIIENGPDRSKEQLRYSARVSSSKRKPGIAEAEQVSKSQKTRKTDL